MHARTTWWRLAAALGVLLTIGCGGAEPAQGPSDEGAAGTGTAGSEAEPGAGEVEPEPVAEPEPEPEPEPTGPGQIEVVTRLRGESIDAPVRILDGSGEVVAEGRSGQTFSLDAGDYRVQGDIEDEGQMVDTPTHEVEAVVRPGQTQTVHVDFPVSRVRIEVTRRGRPLPRWNLTLQRQGEEDETVTLQPSEEHVAITPGRYSGQLHFGREEVEVGGLIFQGGATQTVPITID